MELNHGEAPGGSIPLDKTALSIIEKHGGENAGVGWRFPGWLALAGAPGCQRSSKTDKFLTLIDLIGSGTRFSVDLDVGGREMAVGAVGNRVLRGFPSSMQSSA